MPVQQLKEFLDSQHVQYVSVQHSTAFTAPEIAHRAHIKGDQLAKTVIISMDGDLAMVVMSACHRIRWDRFCQAMGTDFVTLAVEEEFASRFPDCEIGAMPPFGNLFGMPVFIHDFLSRQPEIAFSAGSHSEIIKMNYQDYDDLVKPMVLSGGFVRPGTQKPAWMLKRQVS